MPRCRATLIKTFPLSKEGGAKRQGVVRPAFPNPSRQPPEGFTTAVVSPSSPFVKGDFKPTLAR